MSLAALEAQLGQGAAAKQSVTDAIAIAAKLPADQRRPEGDPSPADELAVIRAAAASKDFATATALVASITDPSAYHDAILAIAAAEISAGQFQQAEDMGVHDGPDTRGGRLRTRGRLARPRALAAAGGSVGGQTDQPVGSCRGESGGGAGGDWEGEGGGGFGVGWAVNSRRESIQFAEMIQRETHGG